MSQAPPNSPAQNSSAASPHHQHPPGLSSHPSGARDQALSKRGHLLPATSSYSGPRTAAIPRPAPHDPQPPFFSARHDSRQVLRVPRCVSSLRRRLLEADSPSQPAETAEFCEHVITSLFSVNTPPSAIGVGQDGLQTPPQSPTQGKEAPPPLGEFIVSHFPPSPGTRSPRASASDLPPTSGGDL